MTKISKKIAIQTKQHLHRLGWVLMSSSSSSSSSLALSFNPLHSWRISSTELGVNLTRRNSLKPKPQPQPRPPHICFCLSSEETRWLREEQRWLREEQRWIREERRWEAERQTLLNEIKHLKLIIEELRREGDDTSTNTNTSVARLLHVLRKDIEVSQIPETGSSAVPLVIEDEEDAQEIVVKAEADVEDVVVITAEDQLNVKRITLRVGSEGDQVRMLQEALLKLGFYCGQEDEEFASFSSGTERAVKTWQSSIGVPETGIMTTELLQRLFIGQQDRTSGFKEGSNGVAPNSITQTPETPLKIVKEVPEPQVSEHRVYLLGENRWEDSSRLKNRSNQSQTSSKDAVETKCITCRGEGRLLCLECDGTGEPNIEPQFLEWVGEDTKCPYCEGDGHTICDVCRGTGVGVGSG